MVSAVLTQFAQNVGVRHFEVKMVETAEIEKQKCFRRPFYDIIITYYCEALVRFEFEIK